jgi:formyltetrahydrofolate deformylase
MREAITRQGKRRLTFLGWRVRLVALHARCCGIRNVEEDAVSPLPKPGHEFVLTVSCPDRPGLVYAVSSFLVQHSANILQSQQFDDRSNDRFFMRVHFEVRGPADLDDLHRAFGYVADSFRMRWVLVDASTPTRCLLMVSRFGHCLNDLLFRHHIGALNIEIPAIVSNHRDCAALAESFGVPFHHIPVTANTKPAAEAQLMELVNSLDIDLVVLARYMQVLSNDLCRQLEGRAINIHHSFLPSFAGAKPYQAAHERGVKLIGATAHYVTPDLDEGPIIEQDVARVDHTADPDDLVAAGRDVEAQVLARAVKWHSERRVLVNDHRTVVFR